VAKVGHPYFQSLVRNGLAEDAADFGFDHAAWDEDGFLGAVDGEGLGELIVVPREFEALEGGAAGFAGELKALGLGVDEQGSVFFRRDAREGHG